MSSGQATFESRLRRLVRKHRAMTRGYKTRMQPDGLIVAYPKGRGSPISAKSVVIFLVAFMAFKGLMIASQGVESYDQRLERLHGGTLMEKAGGFVMQVDPISKLIADQISPHVR